MTTTTESAITSGPQIFHGLTLAEVAKELKVSYSMAKKLTEVYGLPFVAIGKRKVVRRQDLEKWIESRVVVRNP
jgi:excisionase family DNA binding protein